jgi:N-acetylglutamate synthase-like GNAT family acetyltransferase
MAHAMQTRVADLKDVDQIVSVINIAFRSVEGFFIDGDRIEREEVRNLFRKGRFILYQKEYEVVGCVYVEPRGSRAYLGLLSVNPTRQQSGLGSLLMNEAENYARSAGCGVMDILIVNLRTELPEFYQRRGYVETGTTPFPLDVKTRVPCHFINMSKTL